MYSSEGRGLVAGAPWGGQNSHPDSSRLSLPRRCPSLQQTEVMGDGPSGPVVQGRQETPPLVGQSGEPLPPAFRLASAPTSELRSRGGAGMLSLQGLGWGAVLSLWCHAEFGAGIGPLPPGLGPVSQGTSLPASLLLPGQPRFPRQPGPGWPVSVQRPRLLAWCPSLTGPVGDILVCPRAGDKDRSVRRGS